MIPGEENAEPSPANIFFALSFHEAAMVYSLFYERSLRVPNRDQIMDEVERRELYPNKRVLLNKGLDQIDNLSEDLREYLVELAGEEQIATMEAVVKKTLEDMQRSAGIT